MAGTVYALEHLEIDIGKRELRSHGVIVPLGGRAFEILEALAKAAGRVVTKDELMTRIWPGATVGENTLQVHISAVRKALGSDRGLLLTSSGRGYRLAGIWALRKDDLPAAPFTRTQIASPLEVGNLPLDGSELIGRNIAIGRLRDLMSAKRVVTVVGSGGIGKTRLALAAARSVAADYADGAWLVDLVSLSDPAFIASIIASTLGLRWDGDDISAATIAQTIGDRKLLLVLDNCEHLIHAVASLIEVVVRVCPRTTVVATSRELLRIDGEFGYWVAPLETPGEEVCGLDEIVGHSAVQLFLARTATIPVNTKVRPTDLAAIAAICRHLDGIPLAIELASARASALGVNEVLNRLNDRFALLRGGRRTALPRHQTLRAALDWSYSLLPPEEQRYLQRLSLFAGSFTLEGGDAVAGDAADSAHAPEIVTNLVTKSLLSMEQADGPRRWRLLETTRAYALERLQESGYFDETARRHAEYVLRLLASTTKMPGDGRQAQLPSANQKLVQDLRAALEWAFSASGDITLATSLTTAAVPVWLTMSLLMECRNTVQRALNRLAPGAELGVKDRLQLHLALGISLLSTNGVVQETGLALQLALQLAESLGDVDHQLQALWALWTFYANNGQNRTSEGIASKFRELAQSSTSEADVFVGERLMGVTMHYRGRQDDARRHLEQVVLLYEPPSDSRHLLLFQYDQRVLAKAMLARVFWMQGFIERALGEAVSSVEEAQASGHLLSQCYALAEAACPIALAAGDLEFAAKAAQTLVNIGSTNGLRFWTTWGQCIEGTLLIERGEPLAGLQMLRAALAIYRKSGWAMRSPGFLGALAIGLSHVGQISEALPIIDEALAQADRTGEQWCVAELMRIRGELVLRSGGAGAEGRAAESFLHAVEYANAQGSLFWELRASLTLARLHCRQGRQDAARRVLEPVYGRFSEGFASPDLVAARVLLSVES